MSEGLTWEEVDASGAANFEQMRDQARSLYTEMVDHLMREIARTGASIEIVAPGTTLPQNPGTAPIAIRMDVTPATAIWARQRHIDDRPGEKHRSWPVDLKIAKMPGSVKNGITRFVEQVAELQGQTIDRPQRALDL
jgi:hypothetical protein